MNVVERMSPFPGLDLTPLRRFMNIRNVQKPWLCLSQYGHAQLVFIFI